MDTSPKWYALYTKPRWEKKVAERLCHKNIENYCPLNKVQRQWSDRKKIILEPLFKSYVFIRIADTRQLHVQKIDGILNFVTWLGKPAIIRDEEIDKIKCFLNDHTNIRIERADVDLNDTVKILNGPLMMQKGKVIEVRKKTVRLLLPSLRITLVGEIDKTNIEKI